MVKAGVNVNGKNNYDETALHRAAEYGDMEVLSALVDAGVDVDAINTINNTAVSSCTTGNFIPSRYVYYFYFVSAIFCFYFSIDCSTLLN